MDAKQGTRRGLLRAENAGVYDRKGSTKFLRSVDLKDPPRNLEKDFVLKGHFFPQDDIFPAD